MAISTREIKPRGFVELLARSNFSFLQGASHPEEMVEQAIRYGYDGLGLCDIGGLYGVSRGYQTAHSPSLFLATLEAKVGFKYLMGAELILTSGEHLILMPQNLSGYKNLCTLITKAKRNSQKNYLRLNLSDLEKHESDLLAFPLPPWFETFVETLHAIFKDRLYLPVWRDLTWSSREYFERACLFEKELGIPLFVTQRPLMHSPERKELMDVLTCIQHHTTLKDSHEIRLSNSERHLHTLAELYSLWQDRPDLINNTLAIAERVCFDLKEIRYRYPRSSLPEATTPTHYLKELTQKGLAWRYPQGVPEKVERLVRHELQLIAELEYEDYFLTLYDICQYAKQKNILYQGRGSAANSVVCFALGLTSVDPTCIDVLFERFLSKERGEPPDIDIDFEHERREEVIQHIYKKYGVHHAAMVCTVIRYRSKMAFREAAKVFGLEIKLINQLVRYMGRDGLKRLLESKDLTEKFQIDEKIFSRLLNLAYQLVGFPRHIGIHTGGFIITHDSIEEMVPVESSTMEKRFVIQWNKDDVNFLGLMKIDVLSLGMLTAIRKSFELLEKHYHLKLNMATTPQEDAATYNMIQRAQTVGVFQIESRAQMATLPRMRPKTFYDLVIEVALIRPGPLQGGMVHPYLKRRAGEEKITYAHPDLIPILKKTLGIPIFQEQVMRIATTVAGFSPGESDELRRVMSSSWKKESVMRALKDRITSGLKAHGLTDQFADQIYKTIEGFSTYGFPESHAASFALLTYVSCYLKCHFPNIFVCALLNSQPMGFYSPRALIHEAQSQGVSFLPLDINSSDWDYTIEDHAVRQGFRSLAGALEKPLKAIIEERQLRGPFTSLENFLSRCNLSRRILIHLASCEALSFLNLPAREALWLILSLNLDDSSLDYRNQFTFLEAAPPLAKENSWENLERHYQMQGFAIHAHPMQLWRPELEKMNENLLAQKLVPFVHSKSLGRLSHKKKVRLLGLLSMTQRPPTAKGFCFLTLEDEHGFINVVVPPDVYQRDRMLIYQEPFLEVRGTLEKINNVINVKADHLSLPTRPKTILHPSP